MRDGLDFVEIGPRRIFVRWHWRQHPLEKSKVATERSGVGWFRGGKQLWIVRVIMD